MPLCTNLGLPVNETDICVHQIVVHKIKIPQWYTTAFRISLGQQMKIRGWYSKFSKKSSILSSSHLSDSNTKWWLSGSWSAFDKRRLSASTMEIFPQTTCRKIHQFPNLATQEKAWYGFYNDKYTRNLLLHTTRTKWQFIIIVSEK